MNHCLLLSFSTSGLSFPSKPDQSVNDHSVLGVIIKGMREFPVRLVLIINIIMSHIDIEHFKFLISPDYGPVVWEVAVRVEAGVVFAKVPVDGRAFSRPDEAVKVLSPG
jgi:hypothetical protein